MADTIHIGDTDPVVAIRELSSQAFKKLILNIGPEDDQNAELLDELLKAVRLGVKDAGAAAYGDVVSHGLFKASEVAHIMMCQIADESLGDDKGEVVWDDPMSYAELVAVVPGLDDAIGEHIINRGPMELSDSTTSHLSGAQGDLARDIYNSLTKEQQEVMVDHVVYYAKNY